MKSSTASSSDSNQPSESRAKKSSLLFDLYPDFEFILYDEFDEAIVGLNVDKMSVVYDSDKCVEILMKNGIEDEDEAWEYFHFNVQGQWIGEMTPTFIRTI